MTENVALKRKDFASDQEVRWCPGCGDYAILSAVQRTMADVKATLEDTVVISGIGCSSRFPYYMNTYGFHTIHGRAPAFATGLKVARPDLNVWVISGDGDALSIGGNHLLHLLRRNVNVQFLLFNNQIYGLTKGQYSPTTDTGKVTPSSPLGSIDQPVTPVRVALGANAKFVARGYDVSKKLPEVLTRAHDFSGTAFVEILQNCPVFNDGVFELITDRKKGPQHQLWLEDGKPMVLADGTKGIRFNPATMAAEVVDVNDDAYKVSDLIVHDETNRNLAWLIADLPDVKALGVLYCEKEAPVYDDSVRTQVAMAREKFGEGDLNELLHSGHTWTV